MAVIKNKVSVTKKEMASVTKKAVKAVSPVPRGYHSITPYLMVSDAKKAIAFYKKAFDAKEIMMIAEGKKIRHAELKIGDSIIMLSDCCNERPAESFNNSLLHLYIKDVDGIVKRAIKAGATLLQPLEDKYYGDRSGILADPYGHQWCVATRIKNISADKIKKLAAEFSGKK